MTKADERTGLSRVQLLERADYVQRMLTAEGDEAYFLFAQVVAAGGSIATSTGLLSWLFGRRVRRASGVAVVWALFSSDGTLVRSGLRGSRPKYVNAMCELKFASVPCKSNDAGGADPTMDLIGRMVETFQEQQQEIEKLQARNEAFETRFDALEIHPAEASPPPPRAATSNLFFQFPLVCRNKRDLPRAVKGVASSASAICRLEDADYDGHSLSLLKRIADALDRRVEIRFLPVKRLRKA